MIVDNMDLNNHINDGIIFTNDKCIGCNKCISSCIVVGANVVLKNQFSDTYTVAVNSEKCILCGCCIASCVHGSRTFRDDTNDFFSDLENGEKISVLVSPSLLIDYEDLYSNIIGYLKHLGVDKVYNTAFGGDLMVWAYMNFIKDFGLSGVISQFCPVIVAYLEKYKPDLLAYLMPVQSPVLSTAIYVTDYLKETSKLAYISPCIARKHEFLDVNTYGKVSYNVTIDRLMAHLDKIDISPYTATDDLSYGLGALIPMSGGLSDNIELYIGRNEVLIQTEGPTNIFPYFDHYYTEVGSTKDLPFLVDALCCTNGCNFGTGTNCGAELRNRMTFSAHRLKINAYETGKVNSSLEPNELFQELNERFRDFELSSFVRQYDTTRMLKKDIIDNVDMEKTYASMLKYSPESKKTDCGSCGYKTCNDMVYAICTNINHKENCINYSKERIRIETEKTAALLQEISAMNEELKKSTQLKSNFLANMSHEIRTPMNAIIGMSEIALRGNLPEDEKVCLQQIKSSGRSLLAIINDILDFSKIESGKMEINEANYKITSIVTDIINMFLTRSLEKNISLIVECDPNIPSVLFGDDIRIKQVLTNIANNAIKFTDEGFVRIQIEHVYRNDTLFLHVCVEDSGIGIKPDDIKKLFSSFQQVDSKRNRNVEGTGLGLAISKEFISLMNGTVALDSVYGKGSKFSFTIPQIVIDSTPTSSLKSSSKIRILSFITNQYVYQGFVSGISSFKNVQSTVCNSAHDIQKATDYDFLFVDYENWSEEIDSFAKLRPEITVVAIINPLKDVVTSSYVKKLPKPIYSLSIAAILNNEVFIASTDESATKSFAFEAPRANILIVDDNAINLTVAKGLFSPFKMNISEASCAKDAIALIKIHQFDIVFMDHMMPDIDGVEATHIIRSFDGEYFKRLPIIALTANAVRDAQEMFLHEGMDDFVAKPIDMVDVTDKLRKWLPSEKIEILSEISSINKKPTNKLNRNDIYIDGLDTDAGILLAGSVELYRTILSDYYKVIDKKSNIIENYLKDENIEGYTIEVHALKSASKLICAHELALLAEELEWCGKSNDIDTITEKTPTLLSLYRSYKPRLAPFYIEKPKLEEYVVPYEHMNTVLERLYDALDAFDINNTVIILEDLLSCKLDSNSSKLRTKLIDAVEEMDYEVAQALTLALIDSLKESSLKHS